MQSPRLRNRASSRVQDPEFKTFGSDQRIQEKPKTSTASIIYVIAAIWISFFLPYFAGLAALILLAIYLIVTASAGVKNHSSSPVVITLLSPYIFGMIWSITWKVCAGFTGVVLVEHILRINEVKQRPSTALTWVATEAVDKFTRLGKLFARLSSFIYWAKEYFRLDELFTSAHAVIKPTFDLMFSPFWTIYGYGLQAATYAKNSWLVLLGTAVLLGVAGLVGYKFVVPRFFPSWTVFGLRQV